MSADPKCQRCDGRRANAHSEYCIHCGGRGYCACERCQLDVCKAALAAEREAHAKTRQERDEAERRCRDHHVDRGCMTCMVNESELLEAHREAADYANRLDDERLKRGESLRALAAVTAERDRYKAEASEWLASWRAYGGAEDGSAEERAALVWPEALRTGNGDVDLLPKIRTSLVDQRDEARRERDEAHRQAESNQMRREELWHALFKAERERDEARALLATAARNVEEAHAALSAARADAEALAGALDTPRMRAVVALMLDGRPDVSDDEEDTEECLECGSMVDWVDEPDTVCNECAASLAEDMARVIRSALAAHAALVGGAR